MATRYSTTRYSKTRKKGACCTALTKLTKDEKKRLHSLAKGQRISDYELTRIILLAYLDCEASRLACENSQ